MSNILTSKNIIQLNKTNIRQKSVGESGLWDYSAVHGAIASAITGNFQMISQLARVMQADAAFSAALNKRTNAFTRSEFYVEVENNSIDNEAIKYFIIKNFETIFPELQLQRLLKSYLNIGIGFGYLEWKYVDNYWLPTFYALDTENLRYQQHTQKWEYHSYNSINDIEPNNGTYILISSWRPGDLTGFASELGNEWITKKYARNAWIEVNQSFTNPFTIISDDGTGIQLEEADKNKLLYDIQSMKAERVVYMAPGTSLDVKESIPSYSSTTFSDLIEECDRKIQIAILGANTSSEIVDQGARATAEIHNSVERSYTETDIKVFSRELQTQVINHVISVNFGEEYLKNCPTINWKIPSPQDLLETSQALNEFNKLLGGIYQIDNLVELANQFGIKISKKEEVVNEETTKETETNPSTT